MMSSVTGHTGDQDGRDQLLVARLAGAAQRHAPWREPTRQETAAAVAELREIAGSRADLLARFTGGLALPAVLKLTANGQKPQKRYSVEVG